MPTLLRCFRYWFTHFKEAKEKGSDASGLVVGLIGVLFFLCAWLGIKIPLIDSLEQGTYSSWIGAASVAYGVLWCFVWMPFRRQEQQEEKHASALTESCSTIAALQEEMKQLSESALEVVEDHMIIEEVQSGATQVGFAIRNNSKTKTAQSITVELEHIENESGTRGWALPLDVSESLGRVFKPCE